MKNLLLLTPYLKCHKFKIFLVIAALITTSLSVLAMGKIVKYLIDFGLVSSNIDQNNFEGLNYIFLIFALNISILSIAGYFRTSLINGVGERIIANLREKIYKHIILISAQFFENNKIGDVISRLTVDTALLYNIISNSISFLLRNLLLFVGGLIFLFISSPKLTLISIFLIIIAVFPIIFLGKRVKKLSMQAQEKIANITSNIEENINGIKTIQAYCQENKEAEYFNFLSTESLNVSIKKIKVRALLVSLVIALAFSFVGFILYLGSMEVIKGNLTAGELSSFIFYAIITATSLTAISQVIGQLQTASAACGRLFELLETKNHVIEDKNCLILSDVKNIKIEFKNVNFSYRSRPEQLILDNLNLTISNKEKIALIGASGSGKSTIFELLLRFYDVNKGKILINDTDISKLSLSDLRGLFSYISQDCFIFSGTILENICYANKDYDIKIIEGLIANNEAFGFINKLPQGLNSYVGQKGVQLSGGERQRIAILRAIIHNAPIILLDEATSALDSKNEELVSNLLNNLLKDKIAIFITHNILNIKNIDKIIILKEGKITKEGNYQEICQNMMLL